MAANDEVNKDAIDYNVDCTLCAKFINILNSKPEHKMELACDKCGECNEPLMALCVHCKLCLCQICQRSHKTHNIVLLSPITQGRIAGGGWSSVYCPKHQENELDYYCKTCEKFVCLYCTKNDHVGHKFDLMENTASEYRNMLTKIIAPVEEMSTNLFTAKTTIVSTQEKIKEQAGEIDKEIDKCYDEQLQRLNLCYKKLKKELHDAVLQKENALKEQLRNVTSLQNELKGIKKLCDRLVKAPDHEVLFMKNQDIEIHLQKVSKEYENLDMEPVEYDNFEFAPTKDYSFHLGNLFTFANPHISEIVDLPSIAYCRCDVEFKVTAKDSKGKICTKGGSQVSVQLKSFTGDVTSGEVEDNNDGSYMASFVAEQVGEAKLSVSIGGEQIKGSPYSIVVGRNYQAIDKPSKTLNNNGSMGGPWGVAFSRNGLWAVADNSNHCVYIFDDKDQLVRKIGSMGSSSGQFSYPHGVAFDSHNHLYITDNGNHRVQKIDANGNYLLEFGTKGTSDGQLNNPQGVAIHRDKVYIADCDNKRVSVFKTTGKFCFSFGSDQFGCPQDVAVSVTNHLLIADSRNSCISIFTLDGCCSGKSDIRGCGKGQLKSPHSLTADLNGHIIVADACNQGVSVFDKDGNCIHCFGSYGSASGQFKGPYGIALSPNNNIYISDYYNKRVQIFSNF